MEGVVYVSGRYEPADRASVNVYDHGLLYGDGIFEGIRAYNGRVFKLEEHIDRLFASAKAIRLDIGQSRAEVIDIVLDACRRNAVVDGYIRLVVTRGPGDLGIDPRSCRRAEIVVIAKPALAAFYGGKAAGGVKVVTASTRRVAPDALSPAIKSLNYLNNILARIEANDRGADEALMLDAQGYVAEATVDNVFIVVGGGLVTPLTSTNLKGITRATIIELAARAGRRVEERAFTLFDVWTADEAFMCGTGAEIVPILTVDGRTIGDGNVGPVTAQLATAYFEHVRSVGTPIGAPAMQA